MDQHEDGDEDIVVMELACTEDLDEYRELTADNKLELKDVKDKVWWADETDEPSVHVEADLEECVRVAGKRPNGVRWVDVDKGSGVRRSRLMAKDFWPKPREDDVEGLHAATLPLEFVKLLLSNARWGNVCKVTLIDIGKAAPAEGEQHVDLAQNKQAGRSVRSFSSRSAGHVQQPAAGRKSTRRSWRKRGT